MSERDQPVAPSGAQLLIARGDQHAVVVEVGGGLRSYVAGGHELLDGYGPDERCTSGRGQPLIPWPNRVRDGVYDFDGERHQLALTEPERHNAIHGLVRWANWSVAEHAEDRVTMSHVLRPQPGWPTTLALRIEYVLGPEGLAVTTTAANIGDAACPYGAGAHPYLTLGTETIDALILEAPGRRRMVTDERAIPIGEEPVEGTPFDFLEPRPLGDTELDTGYGELRREADGLARVRLSTPGGERGVTLWLDSQHGYLMLFTGDSLPADRRRRGLGVEPMTCAPNALRSGAGLRRLAPGESFTGSWGIDPRG